MENNWASNILKCDYRISFGAFLFLIKYLYIQQIPRSFMPPSLHLLTQSTQSTTLDTWDVISELIGWVRTFLI